MKGFEGSPGVNPGIYVVAVEPMEQMLLTEAKGGEKIGEQGPHKIQGMGAGIVPDVIDLDLVDEVVAVHSDKVRGCSVSVAGTRRQNANSSPSPLVFLDSIRPARLPHACGWRRAYP